MAKNLVVDQFGNGLPSITVELYTVGTTTSPLYTLTTDITGKWDITSVTEGNYDIKFTGSSISSGYYWEYNRFIVKGTHESRLDNPHQTTASQVGAMPASGGTITGNLTIAGNSVVSGSIFTIGDITTSGNLIGNITDTSFGDITTNSITNTASITTDTLTSSNNLIVSGTYFGDGSGLSNISGITATHNNLEGLQGGNSTERYHLLSDERDKVVSGGDLDSHISSTLSVHGTSSSIVGTTDSQLLTNKTLLSPVVSGTLFGQEIDVSGNLDVAGNISGNITDSTFGDITTNSIANTTSISTATETITGNLISSGTVFGSSATFDTQLIYSPVPVQDGEVANKAYVDSQVSGENYWDKTGDQLVPHTQTDSLVISGTTFTQQLESVGINIGGDLNVTGNISGNITDVTFGDITTTSITNSDNITISGSMFIDGTIDGRDISADGTTLDSHIDATAAHGATGAVVGTANEQTLTNKNIPAISGTTVITGDLNVFGDINGNIGDIDFTDVNTQNIINSENITTATETVTGNLIISGTIFGGNITTEHNNLTGIQGGSSTERYHLTQTEHDTIVLTDSTQTLTNKDIPTISGSTTITGDLSVFGSINGNISDLNFESLTIANNLTVNGETIVSGSINGRDITNDGIKLDEHIVSLSVHGVTGNVVGTSDIQTLTNKDMPTISGSTTITGDLNVFGTINGNIGDIDFTNVNTESITNSGNITTATETITGNLVVSGTIFGGNTISVLDDLSDVDTSGETKNSILKFNGSEWVIAVEGQSFTFSIASFTCTTGSTGTVFEEGVVGNTWQTGGAVSFSASYNNGPATGGYVTHTGWASLTLTGIGYVGPTSSISTIIYPSVGSTRTFTLHATDGTDSPTNTITYYFYNRRYWGVSTVTDSYSEADVEGLASNELSNSRSKTFTVSPGADEYIIYSYPTRLGAATFTVGGFEGGFMSPETVSITNSSGFTENYYVYRSTNSNLGSTTVVVS